MHWIRRHRRGRPPHPDVLTPAEWRVLDLVREGLPNAEIAVRLGIAVPTAKTHVSRILAKTGAADRRELAQWDGRPAEAPRTTRGSALPPAVWWSKTSAKLVAGACAAVVFVGAAFLVFAMLAADHRDAALADGSWDVHRQFSVSGQRWSVGIRAEVLEADAPFTVRVRNLRVVERAAPPDPWRGLAAWLEHEARVHAHGEASVVLDDARFMHYVSADGQERFGTDSSPAPAFSSLDFRDGLYLAGRGCSWGWRDGDERPAAFCQDDWSPGWVEPGDSHDYEARTYFLERDLPVRLAPGRYVVEETVRWWHLPPPDAPARSPGRRHFHHPPHLRSAMSRATSPSTLRPRSVTPPHAPATLRPPGGTRRFFTNR